MASSEQILRLLQSSNQDGAEPCWLITVVTGNASSAAADLLSSGNYVIAMPDTSILYHGVRVSPNDPITQEVASALSESFKQANDRYAMSLARKSEWRFMFRFVTLRNDFAKHREAKQNPALTDLQCFLSMIREKLSGHASEILEQAEKRYERYDALLTYVFGKTIFKQGRTEAQVDALILKSIISFEHKENKNNSNWSFANGGLGRLYDDYFLLREYLASAYSEQFKRLCDRWGGFVLEESEKAKLEALNESEKMEKKVELLRPLFQPIWSFFVALCHELQKGENELSPVDAFWLGLIDEVIGAPDLPLVRFISEFKPDDPPATEPPALIPADSPPPALPSASPTTT